MPVRRECAVVRHDAGGDGQLQSVAALPLLDERPGLGDRAEEGEGCDVRRPGVPVADETAVDEEGGVGVDVGVDQLERHVLPLTEPADVRQQMRLGVLRDPASGFHPHDQGASVRREPASVGDTLASLVDVPARPHGGQTIGVEIESSSPEETEQAGATLAGGLAPDDVVTISGELGSGKTTFVRGACRALGVVDPVTSPTYTIGHRYHGRVDVSHLDLYRFTGVSAAEWGDLEPYFSDAICFVEWPEAGENVLPPPRFKVSLAHAGDHERTIMVTEC